MDNNFNLQNCESNDALSFDSGMFKVSKVRQGVKEILENTIAKNILDLLNSKRIEINPGYSSEYRSIAYWKLFGEGIDCEVLKIGAPGWQKGKFRLKVTLEFIPDESEVEEISANNEQKISKPESPLDDLRQMLKQENQQ